MHRFWHGWRGDLHGNPTFFYRDLFNFRGWRVSIHKFVATDAYDCYHSHPANAYRFVLWGGYDEEVYVDPDFTYLEWVRFLSFSKVTPDYIHRIHSLKNGKSSVSLWIRGPKTDEIKLIGEGWKKPIDLPDESP